VDKYVDKLSQLWISWDDNLWLALHINFRMSPGDV
jgi:hypothetical protein